jgi:rare lipoprotein A
MDVRPAQSVAYPPVRSMSVRPFVRAAGVAGACVLLANCASDPSGQRRQLSAQNQREIGAFSNKAKYGSASPRVVQYGSEVPKGGGRDHVGRPYRIAGRWYTPRENPSYSAVGNASWYGDAFHGRKTANGEVYDKYAYSAAHPTMPLPSYARVTNMSNGNSIVVRVNDRGPFHGNRIIDLSERVAHALQFKHLGTARVKVDYLQRANTSGSDDRRLAATLRTDGQMAQLPGGATPVPGTQPVLVASNVPIERPVPASRLATAPVAAPAPAAIEQPVQEERAPVAQSERGLQVAEVGQMRRDVPPPPDRPFDLGGIPGGATPLQRVNNGQQPSPTAGARPAQRDRVAAVYFAPTSGFSVRLGTDDPMRKLTDGRFARIDHQVAR